MFQLLNNKRKSKLKVFNCLDVVYIYIILITGNAPNAIKKINSNLYHLISLNSLEVFL